jgi:hypothetical protein
MMVNDEGKPVSKVGVDKRSCPNVVKAWTEPELWELL